MSTTLETVYVFWGGRLRNRRHSATGKLAFDNYNGHWGEQKELDRFIQGYAVEKAKIEARIKGHSVIEQPLENGSIKLTVSVGGAV